jgi:hypothetical protein
MRGKIRYFFWSTILSAVLLIYSSFNNKAQMKMLTGLKQIRSGAVQQLPDSLKDRLPSSYVNVRPEEIKHVEELRGGFGEDEPQTVSSSRNEYVGDDGANYVLIQGKYYLARADNTYEINGQRVYYVNNRRYSEKEASQGEKGTTQSVSASAETSRANSGSPIIDTADLPTSPADAMKKLQESKAAIQARDKYLETLEN